MQLPGIKSRSASTASCALPQGALPHLLGSRAAGQSGFPEGAPVKNNTTGVCREDFQMLKVLGRGGYGEVRLVRYAKDRQLYAMKSMSKADLHERRHVGDPLAGERAQSERDICVEARHWRCPFLLEMCAAFQTEEKLYFILEYCPGGELFGHLCRSEHQAFDERTAQFYAAETCLALEHLHGHGVIHRDVRLENLLLARDGHVKLSDFGVAKRLQGGVGIARSSMALPEESLQVYYTPEFLGGGEYGKDLDCWQLGVASFLMMTGTLPQPSRGQTREIPSCSAAAASFCREAMQPERPRRLGYPDGACLLRGHPFFQDLSWSSLQEREIGPPPIGAAVAEGANGASEDDEMARDSVARRGGIVDFLRLRNFSFRGSRLLRGSLGWRRSRPNSTRSGSSRQPSTYSSESAATLASPTKGGGGARSMSPVPEAP